ncbi:PqiC family protein [Piscinibacter sakaiensis]|uniref:PqiC family protein n=1 Tax=Piscinibacter sakaiensis TaxID=1547922 RepID=UPI003AAEB24B
MPTPSSRRSALALLCGTALLAVGCASSPPAVRFHSLLGSDAGPVVTSEVAAVGAPLRLVVAPVGIPPAVDQPQWLVRRADDTLQMLEQDRWAAPLADELRAALQSRLAARWGVVDGSLPRQAEADDRPAWRLVVDVQRIDARPGSNTLLDARWSLLPPQRGAAAQPCSTRIVEPVQGSGTVPIAAAYRRSVARLADQIGASLRAAAGSGTAVGCPPANSAPTV